MMATTRSPPAWAAATGASPVHVDEPASRCLVSSNTARSPNVFAQEPEIQADVPPNPHFVFPARLSSPCSAPAFYARAGGRRPMSAFESHRSSSPLSESDERPRRTVALPVFNFNPGASLPQESDSFTFLSPPISPNSPSPRPFPSPSRPTRHGHRRGGSEFVGGCIRDGNSITVASTSPTKSDSGFALPGLALPSRGHRRVVSGTICANDLPLLRPLPGYNMPRGSSAPNSPTSSELKRNASVASYQNPSASPIPAQACEDIIVSDVALDAGRPSTPAALPEIESSSPRQARSGRTRVGFSDKLEFIPKPLSMVSSDTSSTATARPGHSVSSSLSSVVSVASPGEREGSMSVSRNLVRDVNDSRPSTAGAVLERMSVPPNLNVANTSSKRRNSNPTLLSVATSQAVDSNSLVTTSKAPKRWSFFGLESPFTNPSVPLKPRSPSSSSSESVSREASASSDHESDSTETRRDLNDVSIDKQPGKKMSKKNRVKGWAGSILPLKPRGQKKPNRANGLRPPTPPASVDPWEDDGEDDGEIEKTEASEEVADPEDICSEDLAAESLTSRRELGNSEPRPKDDTSQPMIDLDAALGPFNTPLPHNAEWEAAQRAAGPTGKRRMHSAQGMKGFSGPGMHYHRRSESAPDLPPFDPGRSSMHRLNSNSAMADVFEEDEDEDDAAASNRQVQMPGTATLTESREGRAATSSAVLPSVEISPLSRAFPSKSSYSRTPRASSEPVESSASALAPVATKALNALVPSDGAVEESLSIIFCSANTGCIDSATSPRRLPGAQEPCTAVYPMSHNSTNTNALSQCSTSLVSSPHPSPRSPISMEAQRMSTAPSSVTDKNSFQSLLMGEPGPEVRISADYDMRSLRSSNSTMTRDSAFAPSQHVSQPTLGEQRPVYVSSAAFGRRRSSLVSLSRLISSAHGERSKLSMEVTLDNDLESKKVRSKGSRTKSRLGRMMQFWKSGKSDPPA